MRCGVADIACSLQAVQHVTGCSHQFPGEHTLHASKGSRGVLCVQDVAPVGLMSSASPCASQKAWWTAVALAYQDVRGVAASRHALSACSNLSAWMHDDVIQAVQRLYQTLSIQLCFSQLWCKLARSEVLPDVKSPGP